MLAVLEPGLLSSVQDFGRAESVALGVPEGGACDRWSLAVANVLAGNVPDAAALELTLNGPTLRVEEECLVGLAGADLDARLYAPSAASRRLAPGRSYQLRAGQTLAFGSAGERRGVRAYLSLSGGIDVPRILGSASTCLVGGFGGLGGRPLAAGDVLRPALSTSTVYERASAGAWQPALMATRRALRVLPGPHIERLPRGTFERLVTSELRVSGRGDRQGIVLEGPRPGARLQAAPTGRMLSQGVPWGAIQLPPDGQPICLLADRGTVGGYPVVAVVISADLPLLGQLGPGDPLSFREVSLDEASRAARQREADFRDAERALRRPAA